MPFGAFGPLNTDCPDHGMPDQAASSGLGPAFPSGPRAGVCLAVVCPRSGAGDGGCASDNVSDSYVFASSGNSARMMPITCSSRTGTCSREICHTTAQSRTKYRCIARLRNARICLPGDVRIPVSQRIGERASDLAQQEQPVKNGIPQIPGLYPLSTADAIQVLADGPRGVSKAGDVQVITPHTGPAHRSGPDRG